METRAIILSWCRQVIWDGESLCNQAENLGKRQRVNKGINTLPKASEESEDDLLERNCNVVSFFVVGLKDISDGVLWAFGFGHSHSLRLLPPLIAPGRCPSGFGPPGPNSQAAMDPRESIFASEFGPPLRGF